MLRVRRLGRVPYEEMQVLQKALASRGVDDFALILEHPPVYTLGVRADRANILVDPGTFGVDIVDTDRGGDVTFHGPGQIVLYPILTVPDDPGAGREHVRRLEQIVIDVVTVLANAAGRDLEGIGRREGYPGVWVGLERRATALASADATTPDAPAAPAKIAAIGVRVDRVAPGRRRTRHGVALNVNCDLASFATIVPCGIKDGAVTTLAAEGVTGESISMERVVEELTRRVVQEWGSDGWEIQSVEHPSATSASANAAMPAEDASAEEPAHPASNDAEPVLFRRLRKAGTDPAAGIPIGTPKPPWLRVPVRMGDDFLRLGKTIHDLGLVTVCEEAGCPNVYECWADGTATFMVNGSRCTRACGFCQVDTRHPLPVDPEEPNRVAEAVVRMGLEHAVVTCVARDDLDDGGASTLASVVEAIRLHSPTTAVELLISDCKGRAPALDSIFRTRPDVLNHNIETVARLQRAVRPSAGYARSLGVLARAATSGLVVKSGLMVGLGESREEVISTMADLSSVGVSILTIGQYLRPSRAHLPVARFWLPEEFDELAAVGRHLGFAHVEAGPLTRSSYHAKRAAAAVIA